MHRPSLVDRDDRSDFSEESAVVLAQRLAAALRPDSLREDLAAHCDDAARIGVLQALMMSDQQGPDDRLRARLARRREAILALDHAELHFTMRARQAQETHDRQLADALRHATKISRSQLAQEIDGLTRRHDEEAALRQTLAGMTARRSA